MHALNVILEVFGITVYDILYYHQAGVLMWALSNRFFRVFVETKCSLSVEELIWKQRGKNYVFRHIFIRLDGAWATSEVPHLCLQTPIKMQICNTNHALSFITPYAVSTGGLDMKCTVCLTTSWTKGYNFLVLRCVLSFWKKKKEQILHCLEMSSNRCIVPQRFNSYFILYYSMLDFHFMLLARKVTVS